MPNVANVSLLVFPTPSNAVHDPPQTNGKIRQVWAKIIASTVKSKSNEPRAPDFENNE